MRYRTVTASTDPATGRTTGELICMGANPSPTGPNRVPVARFVGDLLPVHGGDGWQPAGDRGVFTPVPPGGP